MSSLTGLFLAAAVLESQLPDKKGASLIDAGGAPQPFPVRDLVMVLGMVIRVLLVLLRLRNNAQG